VTLRWSVVASADLRSIYDFIAEDGNLEAAANVAGDLLTAAERLLLFPLLGRSGQVEGTRELILTPYVIVYRVDAEVILIDAVIHGARRF
jgi:toxin ParE1/3/4